MSWLDAIYELQARNRKRKHRRLHRLLDGLPRKW